MRNTSILAKGREFTRAEREHKRGPASAAAGSLLNVESGILNPPRSLRCAEHFYSCEGREFTRAEKGHKRGPASAVAGSLLNVESGILNLPRSWLPLLFFILRPSLFILQLSSFSFPPSSHFPLPFSSFVVLTPGPWLLPPVFCLLPSRPVIPSPPYGRGICLFPWLPLPCFILHSSLFILQISAFSFFHPSSFTLHPSATALPGL